MFVKVAPKIIDVRRWCPRLHEIFLVIGWVTYTMSLIGVQEWYGCNCCQTQSTPRLVLPHNVLWCIPLFVPSQCLSPLPSVCRPFSWPFCFLEGRCFKRCWKLRDSFVFQRWLCESVNCWPIVPRYGYLVILVKYKRQGPVFSSPHFFSRRRPFWPFFPSWYSWIWSWVALLFYQEVLPHNLLHYFLAGFAGCTRETRLLFVM